MFLSTDTHPLFSFDRQRHNTIINSIGMDKNIEFPKLFNNMLETLLFIFEAENAQVYKIFIVLTE